MKTRKAMRIRKIRFWNGRYHAPTFIREHIDELLSPEREKSTMFFKDSYFGAMGYFTRPFIYRYRNHPRVPLYIVFLDIGSYRREQ